MSASPMWKVYDEQGEYRASFKHVEDAASLLALLGDGASLRFGHRMRVWTEGVEGRAADSYDAVAEHARVLLARGGAQ